VAAGQGIQIPGSCIISSYQPALLPYLSSLSLSSPSSTLTKTNLQRLFQLFFMRPTHPSTLHNFHQFFSLPFHFRRAHEPSSTAPAMIPSTNNVAPIVAKNVKNVIVETWHRSPLARSSKRSADSGHTFPASGASKGIYREGEGLGTHVPD
jgi:hypothetical protein